MIKKAGLVVGLVFALALVAPAAAPVSVSYVTSESMTPTIGTNDGYLLVPADGVEEGDVISFYSAERDSQVTHRAVSVTDDGIVTKGDANPSTDQAAGYPLVQPADVDGAVLTVGSEPLVIPHLGTGLTFVRTYWYLIVALLGAYLVASINGESRTRGRDTVIRSRDIVVPVGIVAVLLAVSLISVGAVHETQVFSVTESPSEDARTLTVGEPQTESFTLSVGESPLTHVITDTDGMRVVDRKPVRRPGGQQSQRGLAASLPDWATSSETQNVTATIPAQSAAGRHATSVHVYTYPAALPRGITEALHGVHPLVAAFASVLSVIAPLYLAYAILVDTTVPLRPTRQRLTRQLGGFR
jgi:signal peptidase